MICAVRGIHRALESQRRSGEAEAGVGLGGLLGVVGGAIAAQHGRGGVAEEKPDIDLAGPLLAASGGSPQEPAAGGVACDGFGRGAEGGKTGLRHLTPRGRFVDNLLVSGGLRYPSNGRHQ